MDGTVGQIEYDARILTKNLKSDAAEADAIAKKAGDDIGESTERGTSRASAALEKFGAVAKGAAIVVGTALVGGIAAATKASWDQVAAVQQATVGLNAYEKNGDKVNSVLKNLIAYARSDMGVLFNRKDLFDSAQALKIMGDNTDDLVGHVKILSRSVGLGLSNWDDLNLIVGRVGSTGRLTGEDFDNLTKAGFKLDTGLRNTNITFAELFKQLDKGIPVDALNGQANTIKGLGIRLETAFRGVGDAILGVNSDTSQFIEGGLGDRLTKGIQNLTVTLKQIPGLIKNVSASFELLKTGDFKNGLFAAGITEDSKLVDVILDIRDAFKSAWQYMKPAVDSLSASFSKELMPALKDLWAEASPILIPALTALAKLLGITIVFSVKVLAAALSALTKVLAASARAWDFTIESIKAAYDAIISASIATRDSLIGAWNGVKTFVSSIPQTFVNLWSSVVTATQNGIAAVVRFFQQLPGNLAEALGRAAGSFVEFVTMTVPSFINGVVMWFEQLPGRVANAVSQMWAGVVNYFTRTRDDASRTAQETVNNTGSWFQQLPGRIVNIALGLWSGVVSGFNSFRDNLLNWANNTVNEIVRYFTDLPGRISSAITGAFDRAKNDVKGFLGDLGNRFQQGFNSSVGRRAAGGPVSANQPYLVGENRDGSLNKTSELFVPRSAGTIVNSKDLQSALGGGGSSTSVTNVTVNMSGIMARSKSDERDIAKSLITRINEELAAKQKPLIGGGAI